jgi:hypothetical protein
VSDDNAIRKRDGTYAPGSPHQRNPHIKDLAKVRKKLQEAVWRATTPAEIIDLLHDIYDIAKDRGEPSHVRIAAAREFFDRTIGTPAQQIELSTKSKVNVNIQQVAVMAREMFGLTAVVNGETPVKQVESREVAGTLPAPADAGSGFDGPVPPLPEAVDSGREPSEDRGEG